MTDLKILQQAVMESRDGITILDAAVEGAPLVFANAAFEKMTGYSFAELLERNYRFVPENDDSQRAERKLIRNAIAHGEHCRLTVNNCRKDGSPFWSELSISPVFNDSGKPTHFICIHTDITVNKYYERQLHEQTLELTQARQLLRDLIKTDELTGLYNRRYFEERLDIQWNISLRSGMAFTLFMAGIDYFEPFSNHYGRLAGDQCLQQVARALDHLFRRASDFVARCGDEEFIVVAAGMEPEQVDDFAIRLCDVVRTLRIPHAKSKVAPYVTLSVGYATVVPSLETSTGDFLQLAYRALGQARSKGCNRAFRVEFENKKALLNLPEYDAPA